MAKIFINPGHGGTDSGAVGISNRKEKEDNFLYAKAVADYLIANGQTVKLYRPDDSYHSVKNIASTANAWGADYFISFHRNSSDKDANGAEVLVVSNASKKSWEMANQIQSTLTKLGFRDRGVKVQDKNTYVLSHTKCPACTIEAGFVTNDRDNKLFDSFASNGALIGQAIILVVGDSAATVIPNSPPYNVDKLTDYIKNIYAQLFSRSVDKTGIDYWVSNVVAGDFTLEFAAFNIIFSDESLGDKPTAEEFIIDLYIGLLGRTPSKEEVSYWIKFALTSKSRYELFDAFIESPEYKERKNKLYE